ncbi:MAG: divergent polysaccharide deacetylase family protein, partial [Pseudolabrys sp.]|nr:divergent polysaccharide deacetylase family protein [Pseudolabrys sp.]
MAAEDLNVDVPLGKDKKKRKAPALPVAMPQLVAGVLGLSVVAVGAWTLLVDDPLGGEPMAVVATKPFTAATSKDETVAAATQKVPAAAVKAGESTAPPPGSTVVTVIDGSSGKKQDVVIPGKNFVDPKGPKGAADGRLLEQTRHGNLPKIGADGTRPSAIYARPIKLPPDKADAPRIALIVGGLGISASATSDAMEKLPGAVTFAFAPFSLDVDNLAAQARAADHEVLLQAPMEPFDYPDNDPGPQTLLT